MNTSIENIKTVISNATVDGNFNSDLIEDSAMRELAIKQYVKTVVDSGADTVLKNFVDTAPVVESPAYQLIILGGKSALVIEKSADYILGKFKSPTFEDKPYFTIGYSFDIDPNGYFYSGHYDLTLVDAIADFDKRTNNK